MNTLQTLIAARALIAKPENWCYGPGTYCVQTAIMKASGYRYGLAVKTLRHFAEVNGINPTDTEYIWDWNDAPERTHAEVLAAFDRAIEAARPKTDISIFTAMLDSSGMALEPAAQERTAHEVFEGAAGNNSWPFVEGEV